MIEALCLTPALAEAGVPVSIFDRDPELFFRNTACLIRGYILTDYLINVY